MAKKNAKKNKRSLEKLRLRGRFLGIDDVDLKSQSTLLSELHGILGTMKFSRYVNECHANEDWDEFCRQQKSVSKRVRKAVRMARNDANSHRLNSVDKRANATQVISRMMEQ